MESTRLSNMTRVFLDTSVLFSATLSSTGASREIIRLALENKLALVLSDYVLEELRQALARKAPASMPALADFLGSLRFERVKPTKTEVLAVAEYSELKDAPVVAAAAKAKVEYLVSLDKRHLVGQSAVAEASGLQIVLPGELLEILRSSK
jgi:putative PIN family toxin of toxin-antitoxin system